MTELVPPRVLRLHPALIRPLSGWARSELLAWPNVDARAGRVSRVLIRLASALVAVGLFSESWDRFLNVQVLAYNVKLPSVVFSFAALALLVATRRPQRILLQRGLHRTVVLLGTAIVVYLALRGALSLSPTAAAGQFLAILSGAVLPFSALVLIVRTKQDLLWAIAWSVAGAVVASAYGLYQLTAFYAGWPQGIEYIGVSIDTGLGRISSFSYEPAYFSYFMLLILGAVIARRRILGGELRWLTVIAFAVMLYLINVRAIPLMIVAFGLLLVLAFSSYRRLLARGTVTLICMIALSFVVPAAIPVVSEAIAAAAQPAALPQQPVADAPSGGGTAGPSAGGTHAGPEPTTGELDGRLRALNPDEQSSNSPRLGLYSAVLAEVRRSPLFGVGPGNLGPALRRDAPGAIANQGEQVVANNIWLQALADGGIPLLLLEGALIAVVALFGVRRRRSFSYPLTAAWFSVLVVGGMLTSYYFDLKIWIALGLLVAGARIIDLERQTVGVATAHRPPS